MFCNFLGYSNVSDRLTQITYRNNHIRFTIETMMYKKFNFLII